MAYQRHQGSPLPRHGDSDQAFASRQFAQRNRLGVGYLPLLERPGRPWVDQGREVEVQKKVMWSGKKMWFFDVCWNDWFLTKKMCCFSTKRVISVQSSLVQSLRDFGSIKFDHEIWVFCHKELWFRQGNMGKKFLIIHTSTQSKCPDRSVVTTIISPGVIWVADRFAAIT